MPRSAAVCAQQWSYGKVAAHSSFYPAPLSSVSNDRRRLVATGPRLPTVPNGHAFGMGHRTGRLASRPSPDATSRRCVTTGLVPLDMTGPGGRSHELDRRRHGFLYVPAGHDPDVAAPLSVKLHGAGSDAKAALRPFLTLADARGMLLLAVDAGGRTWDVIEAGFGPDVAFLDRALERVFEDWAVDPGRISVEGFSDGASYALSLGLVNGDLFGRVVAFSPGYMVTPEIHGRPPVFVSHGVHDRVLPIDRCSRRLVPRLLSAGYDVTYREFDGGHTVPSEVASEAEAWAVTP